MATIQEVSCDILNIFPAFLTEKQVSEINVEMSPLWFRKTRSIDFKCLPERILFFCEEHHLSHPILVDGDDVLLSGFYGEIKKVQKSCY
jgi:hypothetical protein